MYSKGAGTTKRNKENQDNSQSKNDIKDALIIADAVSRGYYRDWNKQDDFYQQLRVIVDEREYWSDQQVNLKNRIQRCLDIVFPEYTHIFIFKLIGKLARIKTSTERISCFNLLNY